MGIGIERIANMAHLIVDQSIKIKAPTDKVWEVLTKPKFNKQWAKYFGGFTGTIESDWKLGSPVLWKEKDGKVVVDGNVSGVYPGKMLRFTVFDTQSKRPLTSESDGITCTLVGHNGDTLLAVRQGDFGGMENGMQYYEATVETWKKVLPKVKELAEK